MHILIIPSEEYIPEQSPLAGIFQKHLISVMSEKSDHELGVLSVKLRHSVPMIIRAVLFRIAGCRVNNNLKSHTIKNLFLLLKDKLLKSNKYKSISKTGKINLVRIEGLYILAPSTKNDYFSWILAGLNAFEAYCEKFGVPDVIHAHNALNAGLLAKKICEEHKIPYVLTEHSSYYYQGFVPKKLYGRIAAAIKTASVYTVVSPTLKETLLATVGDVASSAVYLPNVLPPEFEFSTFTKNRRRGQFVYLSVGNLLPVKGHETLIRAFSNIDKNCHDVLLRIVGDGPLREKLEQLTVDLGVKNRVEFVGEISPESVRSEMHSADVFVFPSQFETFGVAVIEAMSCGLPVLSTECGGPNTIVDKDVGTLVEPDNTEEMTNGLSWAYNNARTFDADNIRNIAINRFGGDSFFKRINQLYEDVYIGHKKYKSL